MPELTERQNQIIALLQRNRFLRNKELAEQLNVSEATIAIDMMAITKSFGCIRQAIPSAARKRGWQEPKPEPTDETPEQMMERLIGDSLPPGPLRQVRLHQRMINHAIANFQQTLELTEEHKMTPADLRKRHNDLIRQLQEVRRYIDAATADLHEAGKVAG